MLAQRDENVGVMPLCSPEKNKNEAISFLEIASSYLELSLGGICHHRAFRYIGFDFSLTPDFDNRPNRRARIFDNRLAAENPIICHE